MTVRVIDNEEHKTRAYCTVPPADVERKKAAGWRIASTFGGTHHAGKSVLMVREVEE